MNQQIRPVTADKIPFWWDEEGASTLIARANCKTQRLKIRVGSRVNLYIDPPDEDGEQLWRLSWKRRTNRRKNGSTKLTLTEIIAAFGLPREHRRDGPNDKIYIELVKGVESLVGPGKFTASGRYLNLSGVEEKKPELSLLLTDDLREAMIEILHLT